MNNTSYNDNDNDQHNRKLKVYTGFFKDKQGRPDFKGLGPILKGVLYLFLFSIIISLQEFNYYFVVLLFLFFIGKVLTAIRFYYIETRDKIGDDIFFIRMNILENYIEGFVALFVMLYMLFGNILTKKNTNVKR